MNFEQLDNLAIALNSSTLVKRQTAYRLAASPEAWLNAGPGEAAEVARELCVSIRALDKARACAPRAGELAEAERERAAKVGSTLLSRHSPNYPAQLLDLELPPPVLYVQGELPERPGLAVVGSRKSDPYGIEVAERFSSELASAGLTVVSGLALGVDSAAHRSALAVGGASVAVLGCGVDVDYPRSNRRLREEMTQSGAVISEFPIGTAPEPHHFPIRNRIIAALGCGTLVVRGTPRSGSLITAGYALALGRQVWAIPGNIFDPRSMGPNSLIRDGAHPVQSTAELLETLPLSVQLALEVADPIEPSAPRSSPERTDLAKLFHAVPEGEPTGVEALIESTGLDLEAILALLVELEIMGFLRRYPGPVWGRCGTTATTSRE